MTVICSASSTSNRTRSARTSAPAKHFDDAWQEACATVSDELGPPAITTVMREDQWRLAAWRVGSVALAVAQSEEFTSYGDLDMAAVWLVRHPTDRGWPAPPDLYSWLLGEDCTVAT
ncbi:hypothetical protein [Streptomyces sp. NPDC056682]|uniref:hypothetical protein n=1 Tax=Streptomyces sp. NPDC056682 TaxID=3345909 RepID=UPI0036D08E65